MFLKKEKSEPEPGTMNKQELEEKIIEVLKTCYDPEIPVDIFELGLIYEIKIDNESNVNINMTLTSPACPVAGSLPGEVELKIKSISEVKSVKIELVWNPPWDRDMMSDVAKVELGMY
jgi:FeS assembly SUF system protein